MLSKYFIIPAIIALTLTTGISTGSYLTLKTSIEDSSKTYASTIKGGTDLANRQSIIEDSIKHLQSKGIKDNSDGMLFLKRYEYYLWEILKGNAFSPYKDDKVPPVYNFLSFSNMIYSETINKIVDNSLSGKDAYEGITGLFERAYISDSDKALDSYLVYLPSNYNPEKAYPLIVFLHGYGESIYLPMFSPGHNSFLAACESKEVIMIAPNGKHKIPGATLYRNAGEQDVLQVINLAKKAYNIDDKRVYLTGVSMGGNATLYIGSRHNELFAAMALSCGYLSSDINLDRLKNTPLYVFHGDTDDIVPVRSSREIVSQLKAKGGNILYKEFPGVGHNAWDYSHNDTSLIEWFLQYSKK
ncbi:MAG: prolyl oligopeptidase family serine peptidase [Clostridia bacterium]|nr:prolyl oligopeptidase family serine peptidase [Clostridia bacterium]